MNAAQFAMYALSLADTSIDSIALDIDGSSWSLIDSAGDFAGLATWRQIEDSLAASAEGWIAGHGLDVYVDGNVDSMRIALDAFRAL